ncbi:MAG: hypothetical protein ISEC1_P0251 [Thiomicrorhabdus sp.]|nr:MAG: hypothetical protein ISEC1_P0251 [Thiomicrorhabdus sp.]
MRIIDQNISLYAHNQSLSRVQKSEQQEEYIGGRLVSQQSKMLDQLNTQSTSYSKNTLQTHCMNSAEGDLHPSKNPANNRIIQGNDGDQRLRSLLNSERANDPLTDRVTLSNQTDRLSQSEQIDNDRVNLQPRLQQIIEVVESLMEKMTGKKTTLQVYGYNSPDNPATVSGVQNFGVTGWPGSAAMSNPFAEQVIDSRVTPEQSNLEGKRLTLSQSYEESETTSFGAAGNITTADGKSINFEINTRMSRHYYSSMQLQIEEGFILQDPLVVNFGGQPATLTVDKVKFDLDSDGKLENMAFLNAGSGFLFLDKNKDGQVNNGYELFGTQSGDGFADLKQYDEDQNGWIDENDSIFSQLQIWHKNTQGMDEMSGLLSLNVGAIYLDNIESPFTFKDNNNQTQGQVVSSGVFLSEDGKVGTVQQIDLAV